MKIIGEKINGTRKRVAKAIAGRDAELIQDLACAYRAGLFNEPQGKTRPTISSKIGGHYVGQLYYIGQGANAPQSHPR